MGAYNDEILLVHIPKTGGTAVKRHLREHVPGFEYPDPKDEKSRERTKLPIGHIPLRDIPKFTGRPLESWGAIIAVLRNPYEQQLSQWRFWADRYARGQRHVHDIMAASCPDMGSFLKHPDCDFHIWYQHRFHPGEPIVRHDYVDGYAQSGGYYYWWLEVDGAIPDNVKLLKQESLDRDLRAIIDVPPLPVINKGPKHADWREYFRNPEAVRIVNDKFRWTFEQGHYPVLGV